MKIIFKDPDLEDLYNNGTKCKVKKFKKLVKNKAFVDGYQRAVFTMLRANSVDDLRSFSFLHYEKLKRIQMSSVRPLNGMVERLLFTETEDGLQVELLEIDSTHYGNKK